MVRRFFSAVLLLLSYMAGAAGILVLTLAISLPLAIISVILIVIGFVPVMNTILQSGWDVRMAMW
jgi:hypothetical protein